MSPPELGAKPKRSRVLPRQSVISEDGGCRLVGRESENRRSGEIAPSRRALEDGEGMVEQDKKGDASSSESKRPVNITRVPSVPRSRPSAPAFGAGEILSGVHGSRGGIPCKNRQNGRPARDRDT